jgi:lysine 6-dehydrogenase
MRVVLLGAGLVGRTIALDLAADGALAVTVVDHDERALARLAGVAGIDCVPADLRDPVEVERVVAGHDLVVGAVPGHMGFVTLQTVVNAGKNVVDISFFAEDPFALDELAKRRGVTAVVDCGVAPGCDNLILGHAEGQYEQIDRFVCLVGGLPVVRTWPWEYRAVFSPSDVLEEYSRPARYVVDSRLVTMPALSEPELIDFPGVGTLEAFNTDGLRSLLRTVKVPSMIEKTLRYPGHIEKIRVLRESGFFAAEPVSVGGVSVRPIDVTSRLLFPAWHLGEGEEDLTVMRVEIEGRRGGRRVRECFDLLDRFDRQSQTSSMARTTGYTCTAAVRALARGVYTHKGIPPPEYLGRVPACFDLMMAELATRGVRFHRTEADLGAC